MSLIALAHAAPAPPPFNATFYATAATIIPVLFLAIAVQGRAYDNLLKTLGALLRGAVTGPVYQQAAAAAGRGCDVRVTLPGVPAVLPRACAHHFRTSGVPDLR
jgi:hypothetical protein